MSGTQTVIGVVVCLDNKAKLHFAATKQLPGGVARVLLSAARYRAVTGGVNNPTLVAKGVKTPTDIKKVVLNTVVVMTVYKTDKGWRAKHWGVLPTA